jgi:hypothetical protein
MMNTIGKGGTSFGVNELSTVAVRVGVKSGAVVEEWEGVLPGKIGPISKFNFIYKDKFISIWCVNIDRLELLTGDLVLLAFRYVC